MTDLYRLLGVSRQATESEIRSAYRRLARKYHPDVCPSPDASARFAKISEAYRILGDPRKRDLYDRGVEEPKTTYYASHAAEVVAYQRKLDRLVDELIANERQEVAARRHAVTSVVSLFISGFFVALFKPVIIEDASILGRIAIVALFLAGVWHVIKNLRIALARYTYTVPDRLISVFHEPAPSGKTLSRRVGVVLLVAGYIVSLGLGYAGGELLPGGPVAPSTLLGILLYPPIAVLIMGSFQRLGSFLDRP